MVVHLPMECEIAHCATCVHFSDATGPFCQQCEEGYEADWTLALCSKAIGSDAHGVSEALAQDHTRNGALDTQGRNSTDQLLFLCALAIILAWIPLLIRHFFVCLTRHPANRTSLYPSSIIARRLTDFGTDRNDPYRYPLVSTPHEKSFSPIGSHDVDDVSV